MQRIPYGPAKAIEAAYVAGLFDGEGSVSIASARAQHGTFPQYWLFLNITNTDEGLIAYLRERFGGFVTSARQRQAHHRPCWKWTLQSEKAVEFLRLIRPHVRIKGPQIDLALEFQRRKRRWHHKHLTAEVIEQRANLKRALSALNSRLAA